MQKSGKSTVSFTFLGKIYRFFAEIRRMKDRHFGPEFLSLKAASCLSEFTQTWREKPAKPLRLGVLFRQIVQTWRENQAHSCPQQAHSCLHQARPGALRSRGARDPGSHHPPGEKTGPLPAFPHKKTRYPHEMDTGLKSRSHLYAPLTCGVAVTARLATDLRCYRLKSPPKMSETGRSV